VKDHLALDEKEGAIVAVRRESLRNFMTDFRSDNAHGWSPEIAAAVARAGETTMAPYGFDEISARLHKRVRDLFETDLEILPLATGTAANALALAAVTPPWGGVICHDQSHIQRDEMGAPEFFTSGAKLIPLPGDGGKLSAASIGECVDEIRAEDRMARVTTISLTQATEAGTCYSVEELEQIGEVARSRGLAVHVDGARFANALVSSGKSPADLSWRAGVDLLVFGATKNGAIAAELLVIFKRDLAEELVLRRHRSGHRLSKMRFIAAQLEAYLENDLWLRNAAHANAMAQRLATRLRDAGVEVIQKVEANVVFVRLDQALATRLQRDFDFYDWPLFGHDAYRLVCGFRTSEDEVDALVASVRS
jgi:threonine aldolase